MLVWRIVSETGRGGIASAEVVRLEGKSGQARDAGLFAVFASGGKQHRVVCGDTVRLERVLGEPGDTVSFPDVLLIAAGDNMIVGTPHVDGALVTGKLVAQGRGRKIRVIKFKRRKNYLRHKGHRQHFSEVLITGISHPPAQIARAGTSAGEASTEASPTEPVAPPAAEQQAEAA